MTQSGDTYNYFENTGPGSDVQYPIEVFYCGECGLPTEYCEYSGDYDLCKKWLEKHAPNEFQKLDINSPDDSADGDAKKRQTRGGKAVSGKSKKKQPSEKPQLIFLSRAPRGKRKYMTVVQGLSSYDIDLKDASKWLGQRFACGSSVSNTDEIVIQGDVKEELFDLIPDKWPQISEDSIEDLGDQKR